MLFRSAEQGWGVGIHRYSLAAHAPWMDPQVSELTLLISHQDQVTELPQGATVIASSDFCPNAAYHIGDQVLCFQGHPEFVHDYSKALLDARQAYLGDEVYHKAVASLATEHQGDLVGEWMLRFIEQPVNKGNLA